MRLVQEDDRAYDELIERGFRAVPVTCVGDRCVAGYDEPALASLLEPPDAQLPPDRA